MNRHHQTLISESDFTLARARIPSCFLKQLPEGVHWDDEGNALLDVVVERGTITALRPSGTESEGMPSRVDLGERLVWAPLIDMHAHLDKGQIVPRSRPDGTHEGGVRITGQDRRYWTADDIATRMRFGLQCAYVHGVAAIRTHIDSHEHLAERSWSVFKQLRTEWNDRISLQAVGMVPLEAFRGPWGAKLADLVADAGGVLGAVTDGLGTYEGAMGEALDDLLDRFLRVAADRGLDVDLHVDQSDDLKAFALPHIAQAALRSNFRGRVVCSHCVNLALQSEEVADRTISLARDAGLAFVTLPTSMMYLQDRRPGRTPRWRGVTLAKELQAGRIGDRGCRR